MFVFMNSMANFIPIFPVTTKAHHHYHRPKAGKIESPQCSLFHSAIQVPTPVQWGQRTTSSCLCCSHSPTSRREQARVGGGFIPWESRLCDITQLHKAGTKCNLWIDYAQVSTYCSVYKETENQGILLIGHQFSRWPGILLLWLQ